MLVSLAHRQSHTVVEQRVHPPKGYFRMQHLQCDAFTTHSTGEVSVSADAYSVNASSKIIKNRENSTPSSKKSVKDSLKSVNKHIRVSTCCAHKFQPARKFSQVA